MSLNIKTASGLQRIAGSTVILDATTSELRSGTFTLSGTSWATQDITFTTPMPDINYVINIECASAADLAYTPFRITNKTVNGFTLGIFSASNPITYTGKYYAIRLVELEGYTEVQNKVDNPDSSPTENSTNLVTSGGVYEAIQNATKVFIGTEQEWEDETDKTKFQLAVLTDRTQINAVDETTGDTEVVADKTKRFTGTQAEWDALTLAEKTEYEIVCITDDGETSEEGFKEYIKNQNILSEPELMDGTSESGFTLSTTDSECPYDGLITFGYNAAHHRALIVNNVTRAISGNEYGTGTTTYPVKKGDLVRVDVAIVTSDTINNACWYKLRDYTGR